MKSYQRGTLQVEGMKGDAELVWQQDWEVMRKVCVHSQDVGSAGLWIKSKRIWEIYDFEKLD